jgi:SAM-dependent methyltransferase
MNEKNNILKQSHYQTFDFLGDVRRDSDSPKKYELSRLDAFDLADKSVCDAGCNAGYFLFRLLGKRPRRLVGVDLGAKFISIAKDINAAYFRSPVLEFVEGDFFDLTWPFDLIICLSTFHYFGSRQKLFFEHGWRLLKKGGEILLEVEEHPENDVPRVTHVVRPADRKSYPYPNSKMIGLWVQDMFEIKDRYQSIKQGGSLYDRYFYRLQKI